MIGRNARTSATNFALALTSCNYVIKFNMEARAFIDAPSNTAHLIMSLDYGRHEEMFFTIISDTIHC